MAMSALRFVHTTTDLIRLDSNREPPGKRLGNPQVCAENHGADLRQALGRLWGIDRRLIPPFPNDGKRVGHPLSNGGKVTHIIHFSAAAFTYASTSSAWPCGVTGENTCSILPSGPIRKVDRTIPMTFLPYMFFSLSTSNSL